MINYSSIKSGLYGMIGVKQPVGNDNDYAIMDAVNRGTTTGLYYKDYHKLITVQNLYHIAPEDISDDEFNAWWKEEVVEPAIVKVVKQALRAVQSQALFEHNRLYDHENVPDQLITVSGDRFVGYEIDATNHNNVRVIIDALGAFFDGSDTFTLYLFHSHQSDALQSTTITATEAEENWQSLDWDMDYATDDYVGGKFYVGYKWQDLTAQPVNRRWNRAGVENVFGMFGIRPMSVADYTGTTMFDPDDITYEADTFGLNFEFTAKPDYTKMIVTQKDLFVDAIGYQVAADCLEAMAHTTRTNPLKQEVRDLALGDIAEGITQKKLDKAIKDVKSDLSGADPITLPKGNRMQTYTFR